MTVWWTDNHALLAREREAVATLQSRAEWLENVQWSFDDSVRIQIVFDIRMGNDNFNLKLTYHNTFPYSAPSVAPVDPSRLSGHQYGNGDLCLEIRPDNWREEFTGADMIESAFSLLERERPGPDGSIVPAPSAHNVPETINIRQATFRLYLSEAQCTALAQGAPQFTNASVILQWCGENFFVAHLRQLTHEEWSWRSDEIPNALSRESSEFVAAVVRTSRSSTELSTPRRAKQLIDLVGAIPGQSEDVFSCIAISSDGDPTLFRKLAGIDELIVYRTVRAPNETIGRTGEIRGQLGGVRVGVVGLGSLGSKVAVSLARAGVLRFDLVDDDLIHPGNLERHDGDWRDIGLHKADVVKRRIGLVSNKVRATARRVSVGAQVSTTEAAGVNGALSECDVIVDATANSHVFNHLTAIAMSANSSLVWGGIYAGGIGGYIARSRPSKDPEPLVVRQALNDFYDTVDVAPPLPLGDGYDAGSHDTVMVAADPAVSVVATHLASFVTDCALRTEPSIYDHPLYLIGLERTWIFESAFHVQPISVNAPARAPKPVSEPEEAQVTFVGQLLKQKLDEIANREAED
ncbi:MAG: ThiF family adenylyltransferase [Rhodospirillales bacterium]|nr:ThiF family adenylyltransferase [Rhodospirillales bacterium]